MIVTGKSIPRRTFLQGVGRPRLHCRSSIRWSPAFAASPETAGPPGLPVRAERHRHEELERRRRKGALAATFPRIMKPLEAFCERHDPDRQPHAQQRPRAARRRRRSRPLRRAPTSPACRSRRRPSTSRPASRATRSSPTRSAHETRFASLELGMDDSRQAGDCDSGYSCAYTNNLAWRSETQPLPPILDPRALFERLFGTRRGPEPRGHGSAGAVPPQHPGLRHRRTRRSCSRRSAPPTSASSTSTSRRSAKSSGSWRRRRRRASPSTPAWTSRTACRPTSPSTSS